MRARHCLECRGQLSSMRRSRKGDLWVVLWRKRRDEILTTCLVSGKLPYWCSMRGGCVTRLVLVVAVVALFGCQPVQGERGEKGDRGPQGERGLPGDAGEKGDVGAQGVMGDAGERGPIGPQGVQGPVGPQGEQGRVGPQGPQGMSGQNGDPGSVVVLVAADGGSLTVDGGVVIVAGPQGPRGDPGSVLLLVVADGGSASFDGGIAVIAGPVGPQGVQGAAGVSVVGSSIGASTECPFGGVRYDGASGSSYVCNGAPGQVLLIHVADGGAAEFDGGLLVVTGPLGPTGSQGAVGATGESGPVGAAGPAGRDGDQFGEAAARFAGFTTATTNGAAGGRRAMHARCVQEYPGSHMCHAAEFALSNSTVDVPAGGAWMDPSAQLAGRLEVSSPSFTSPDSARTGDAPTAPPPGNSVSCAGWLSSDSIGYSSIGTVATPTGAATATCDTTHVVACCSTPYREQFAGFTTATTSGAIGGRSAAHRVCHAEFPGSHFCHQAEFSRATSSVSPPSVGAWIDYSFLSVPSVPNPPTPSEDGIGTRAGFARAGRVPVGGCVNWTWGAPGNGGAVVTDTGILSSGDCDKLRALACCR